MSDGRLRDALRLYAEQDAPFEDIAVEVGHEAPDAAVVEVRRAAGLGWLTPDEAKILLAKARQ